MMKEQQKQLYYFLRDYVRAHIRKYMALGSLAIGPDARFQAQMTAKETDELLQLADILVDEIRVSSQDASKLNDIYNEIRFYFSLEQLRVEAGWWVDPGIVHERLKKQMQAFDARLDTIGEACNFSRAKPARPQTALHLQLEQDSYAIAFRILDMAVKLRESPNMAITDPAFNNTKDILKSHASGHYRTFEGQILAFRNRCQVYLERSGRSKSEGSLDFQGEAGEALRAKMQMDHERQLQGLEKICPELAPTKAHPQVLAHLKPNLAAASAFFQAAPTAAHSLRGQPAVSTFLAARL